MTLKRHRNICRRKQFLPPLLSNKYIDKKEFLKTRGRKICLLKIKIYRKNSFYSKDYSMKHMEILHVLYCSDRNNHKPC